MTEFWQLLATALLGAIIGLLVKEAFAWKFQELERRRKDTEKLLERVFGPIYAITQRIPQTRRGANQLWIITNDYYRLLEITSLYSHDFTLKYSELLDFFKKEANWKLQELIDRRNLEHEFNISSQQPDRIIEFVKMTEKTHQDYLAEHRRLQDMRSGFWKNIRFILKFWAI